MALNDLIRRNVAEISETERNRLRDAFVALSASKRYPDGVSYWDKQNAIHQATHVHGTPAFLAWHRELCNRLERLLREVDPSLSLHYWDWTTDPTSNADGARLFTAEFMGSANGDAGRPFQDFESTEGNGHKRVWRAVRSGLPAVPTDAALIGTGNDAAEAEQFSRMREALRLMAHDVAHSYIGGTIGQQHFAFHDPFVFLLHSNVDRLWAKWQTARGRAWRKNPDRIYGREGTDPTILSSIQPWAGGTGLRPWAPPENQQVVKNCRDLSVVGPPLYDTNEGLPSSKAAALRSGPKTYFFAGTRYIRVTRGNTGAGTIDPGYPTNISVWGWGSFGEGLFGLWGGIDAALDSGPKTYFFAGTRYIRVTRGDTGPGTIDPGYPKNISEWGWPADFRDSWV